MEMLVIVLIVGVLAAISAPSWLGLVNRQRVNAARDEIVQTIRSSQGSAKQKRRTQNIVFKVDGTNDLPTLEVEGVTIEVGSDSLKPDMVTMTIKDSTGAAITSDHTLTFAADGTVATTVAIPFSIEMTAKNSAPRRCVIVQTLLGSLRLESGSDCDVIDI